MKAILSVFCKEFNSFFTTPAAWLFLGGFQLITLFIFFWAEAFFARNIADMKPLFQWMPILLIFLVAALTMRSWSEERRAGTIESLLTSPVTPLQFVLGKFLAIWSLVTLALSLTLPLPITVSLIGSLDWGPVLGGYLASLFLAAAYISIGLYMSARTDNPVVALILSVAVTGVFYLLGSPLLTTLFGQHIGETLELLGSGSRFKSIVRGVIDLRDLTYYLSIVGIFLTLNLLKLEKLLWTADKTCSRHKQWGWLTGLVIINFVLLNFWLNPIAWARMDLTEGNIYSLSPITKQYVQQLQEPLLIRGYFSDKSHPLLEPLVPQIKDILEEFQVVGREKVTVEFVDPHTDQTLEQEAAEKYGIRPVPFRMASRYQSGVVNSYFDLVIAYGDQYETLSFNDLIEVKTSNEGEPEVLLKNPEYAITRAIRKVANTYQSGGNVFANLQKPLTFHGYISADSQLPAELAKLSGDLKTTLDELKQQANGNLKIEFSDPDAENGILAKKLQQDFGFSPQIASLFDPKPFWFYMVLEGEGESILVPLPAELDHASLKKSILAAVQRMAPGYLKTVALVTPKLNTPMNPYTPSPGGKQYEQLRNVLGENVRLKETRLENGYVPVDADILMLLAPENLDQKQVYAVDQFLMQGGSVVLASSPFDVDISDTLTARTYQSGLKDWLVYHGLDMAESMVLDPQNASLPVPVRRQLGMISVNEIQMMPYPHFPDLRGDGLNKDNPMTSGLAQLSLNWVSPITIDEEKNKQRKVIKLLHSSEQSWTSDDLNVLPDYERYPETGFRAEEQRQTQLLAVAVKGQFQSYFKGKKPPLLEHKPAEESKEKAEDKPDDTTVVGSIIERSSDSAQIILIASNSFASDDVISLASQGQGSLYTPPLEFMQNAIDWTTGDQGLMVIRSRAQFARLLEPMQHSSQLFWEYLNYFLAFLGLLLVWFRRRLQQSKKQAYYNSILAEV